MINALVNKNPRQVFNALAFAFPVFLGTVKSWHSALFLLMVLYGLFHAAQAWSALDRKTKVFIFAIGSFILFAAVSLVNAEDLHQGAQRLLKLAYLLGMLVLILSAGKLKLDLSKAYSRGMMVGGVCMGCVAIYQTLVLSRERAQGVTHPIVFGDLAMLLAMLLLVYLIFRPANDRLVWPILSFAAALIASFLSLSRGGWAVIPLLGVVAPFFLGRQMFKRRFLTVTGVIIVFTVVISVSCGDIVQQRLDQSYTNIVSFMKGENLNSSIGQRFLMWDIAIKMFSKNPLLGSGLGDFRHDSAAMMEAGTTSLQENHGHAHSIYFEMLATTGLLGFVSMTLALVIVPLGFFMSFWRNASNHDQRRVALSGMMAVFCFAVFGLSESWVSRSPFMVVYCVTVFVYYSASQTLREDSLAAPSHECNEA